VKEVFISRRLSKWGRRVGFVRFFEVDNMHELEKELDQIHIGNETLCQYSEIQKSITVSTDDTYKW